MPKLPVATNFWTPQPDLYTGAEAWILAGGAHHTAFTYDLTAEQMGDWRKEWESRLYLLTTIQRSEISRKILCLEIFLQINRTPLININLYNENRRTFVWRFFCHLITNIMAYIYHGVYIMAYISWRIYHGVYIMVYILWRIYTNLLYTEFIWKVYVIYEVS